MLVDDYLRYIGKVRRLSANTVRLHESYLSRLAKDIDLAAATTAQLREWIARDEDWSPATVNAVTAAVRSFYRWADETSKITPNPARALHGLKLVPKPARIASEAQCAAGVEAKRIEIRAVTLLGAECGLRVHEIAKLSTHDRSGEWLDILGKGGQRRTVHMSPELMQILDEIEARHGSGFYFRGRVDGHVHTATVRGWVRQAMGINPHALRHRAGTNVYRGTGNNLRVTQVFLGHRYPATTAIYVHVERDDLLQASQAARLAA